MLEIFGGPDRDRTDDLFHAIHFSAIIDTRAPPRVNSRATKTTEGVTGPRRFAPWASQKDSL